MLSQNLQRFERLVRLMGKSSSVKVLVSFSSGDGKRIGDIANELQIERITVTRRLREFEAEGIVVRRGLKYYLTERGEKLVNLI